MDRLKKSHQILRALMQTEGAFSTFVIFPAIVLIFVCFAVFGF